MKCAVTFRRLRFQNARPLRFTITTLSRLFAYCRSPRGRISRMALHAREIGRLFHYPRARESRRDRTFSGGPLVLSGLAKEGRNIVELRRSRSYSKSSRRLSPRLSRTHKTNFLPSPFTASSLSPRCHLAVWFICRVRCTRSSGHVLNGGSLIKLSLWQGIMNLSRSASTS